MPIKSIESVSFFDVDTNKPIMKLDEADCVTVDYNEINHSIHTFDDSASIEIEIKQDDIETVKKAFGVDEAKQADNYGLMFVTNVQKRRHRKRRINKKWAKRYGYYLCKYYLKDGKIINYSNKDNSFDITFSKLVKQ